MLVKFSYVWLPLSSENQRIAALYLGNREKRRDEVLGRLLRTPPTPHKPKKRKGEAGHTKKKQQPA